MDLMDGNGVLYLVVGAVFFHLFIIALIVYQICRNSCKKEAEAGIRDPRQRASSTVRPLFRTESRTEGQVVSLPRRVPISEALSRDWGEQRQAGLRTRESPSSGSPPIFTIQIDVGNRQAQTSRAEQGSSRRNEAPSLARPPLSESEELPAESQSLTGSDTSSLAPPNLSESEVSSLTSVSETQALAPPPFSGLPSYEQVVGNEPEYSVATEHGEDPPPYDEVVRLSQQ